MGHQVNFFVLPGDLPVIEAAIRATGDVCFLIDQTSTAVPAEVDTFAITPGHTGHRSASGYVVRRSNLDAVSMRFVTEQGYWLIEPTHSPVIEFSPGHFDGTVLTRGRAYFATNPRFRPEPPSPDFVKWGDRVLGRIKMVLTPAPDIAPLMYISANALQWIREEDAEDTGGAVQFQVPRNV